MNYWEIIQWRIYTVTPMRLLSNMAGSSLQCHLTMTLSNVKGMCVSSWRFATSLDPCVNVKGHQCGAWVGWMWCEALVINWKSPARWWRLFLRDLSSMWWTTKFEWSNGNSTPAADRPTSRPATESWHCWQGWPVCENEETYIDGLDANNI